MDRAERFGIRIGRTLLIVAAGLVLVQAVLFHDYFTISLTLLVGVGLGIWLRHWFAGVVALATFVIAFALAALTGWLDSWRLVADPLLGAALAFLGGAIAGGIFQLLRLDAERGAARTANYD